MFSQSILGQKNKWKILKVRILKWTDHLCSHRFKRCLPKGNNLANIYANPFVYRESCISNMLLDLMVINGQWSGSMRCIICTVQYISCWNFISHIHACCRACTLMLRTCVSVWAWLCTRFSELLPNSNISPYYSTLLFLIFLLQTPKVGKSKENGREIFSVQIIERERNLLKLVLYIDGSKGNIAVVASLALAVLGGGVAPAASFPSTPTLGNTVGHLQPLQYSLVPVSYHEQTLTIIPVHHKSFICLLST